MISRSQCIRLIDVDSKIPNLALMKLSTFFKSRGYMVGFDVKNPCAIFSSCVFKANAKRAKHQIDALWGYKDLGGTGVSLTHDILSYYGIDLLKPDYSLYPNCEYSMGFTTRGCVNHCGFCVVPKKEGKIRKVQHPEEFYDPSFSKIMYLDGNITSLDGGKWFSEVCQWSKDQGLKVSFNQGIDVRLMTPEIACVIRDTPTFEPWHFAYDINASTDKVLAGMRMLKDAGVRLRSCLFYVYVPNDEAVPLSASRCDIIKMMGGTAYAMCDCDAPLSEDMRKLKRYTRPWVFWSTNSFWEYGEIPKYKRCEKVTKLDEFGD